MERCRRRPQAKGSSEAPSQGLRDEVKFAFLKFCLSFIMDYGPMSHLAASCWQLPAHSDHAARAAAVAQEDAGGRCQRANSTCNLCNCSSRWSSPLPARRCMHGDTDARDTIRIQPELLMRNSMKIERPIASTSRSPATPYLCVSPGRRPRACRETGLRLVHHMPTCGV